MQDYFDGAQEYAKRTNQARDGRVFTPRDADRLSGFLVALLVIVGLLVFGVAVSQQIAAEYANPAASYITPGQR